MDLLIGKYVKVTWIDGINEKDIKGVKGRVIVMDNNFITLNTKLSPTLCIALSKICSIKEVVEDEQDEMR